MNPLLLPGVYAPQDDTRLLVGALHDEPLPSGAHVLDMGTGSGVLALAAARRGARVTAVDASWRAVSAARVNALLAGVRLRVRHGHLFEPVRGETFDLVLANPPYVPTPHDGPGAPHDAARAWDAGRDGRLVLDEICREAPAALRPGGVLLVVQSALSAPCRTLERLRAAGLKAAVTRRRRVPFGPVLRGREAWLRERALLDPAENTEELVVIRAEHPV